jgi:hypothetical protein
MQDQVEKLSNGITLLTIRVASTSLSRNPPDGPSIDELRGHIKAAQEVVRDLRQAIAARDAEKSRTELARFRKSFVPVRDAAKRQPK